MPPMIWLLLALASLVSGPLIVQKLTLAVILLAPPVSIMLFAWRLSVSHGTDYRFSWRDGAMVGVMAFSVVMVGTYLWYIN